MKTKICLPIIKQTKQATLAMISDYQHSYDMFEIWIDYITDLDNQFLLTLIKTLPNMVILVFRRQPGETVLMKSESQKKILQLCSGKKVYIDLDIALHTDALQYIKAEQLSVQLILSFHDYERTPRTSALVKIVTQMQRYNPTIYKLATFCATTKQALLLMHLLLDLKNQNKKIIILGMGYYGKITRIFGALYGNEITFAPETMKNESAPQQLTRIQLQSIIASLEN